MTYATVASLCTEICERWPGVDPDRVLRAAELVTSSPYNILPARRDEHDQPIKPDHDVLAIRGQQGWYVVRKHSCTCQDHARGNVCKHRIAAWIHQQLIIRNYQQSITDRRPAALIVRQLSF